MLFLLFLFLGFLIILWNVRQESGQLVNIVLVLPQNQNISIAAGDSELAISHMETEAWTSEVVNT